jgi:hypothetical protein
VERARSQDPAVRSRAYKEVRLGAALPLYPGAPSAVSGSSGEFRLTGIGRDRVVLIHLEGPTVEGTMALVLNSPGLITQPLAITEEGMGVTAWHGPRFELTLRPGRQLEGSVRDLETGLPIPGIRLLAQRPEVESFSVATSDRQGNYLLPGVPLGKDLKLTADPLGQPYFAANRTIGIPPGAGPFPFELVLERGVRIEGRVTRLGTGEPVRARVSYFPLKTNAVFARKPRERNGDDYASTRWTDYDGRYAIVVPPGPGLLYVQSDERGLLNPEGIVEELRALAAQDNPNWEKVKAHRKIDLPGSIRTLAAYSRKHRLEALTQDFALEPGREVKLEVTAPDGSPAAGVSSLQDGATPSGSPGAFRHFHETPGAVVTLPFLDPARSLGGLAETDGREPGPVRVALNPTGRVRGRLIDQQGRPRARACLDVLILAKQRTVIPYPERVVTDAGGRFEITGVIPGCTYRIDVAGTDVPPSAFQKEGFLGDRKWSLKPGETVDWGDVRVQPQ